MRDPRFALEPLLVHMCWYQRAPLPRRTREQRREAGLWRRAATRAFVDYVADAQKRGISLTHDWRGQA